jgi:hypothetical protein
VIVMSWHGLDYGNAGGPAKSFHGGDLGNLSPLIHHVSYDRYVDTHIGDVPKGFLGPRCTSYDDTKIDPIASYGSDQYRQRLADSVGPSITPKYNPDSWSVKSYRDILRESNELLDMIKKRQEREPLFKPIRTSYFTPLINKEWGYKNSYLGFHEKEESFKLPDITPMKSTEVFSTNLDDILPGLRSVDKFHAPNLPTFPYPSHEQIFSIKGIDQDDLPDYLVRPFGNFNRHSLFGDFNEDLVDWDDDLDDIPEVW